MRSVLQLNMFQLDPFRELVLGLLTVRLRCAQRPPAPTRTQSLASLRVLQLRLLYSYSFALVNFAKVNLCWSHKACFFCRIATHVLHFCRCRALWCLLYSDKSVLISVWNLYFHVCGTPPTDRKSVV